MFPEIVYNYEKTVLTLLSNSYNYFASNLFSGCLFLFLLFSTILRLFYNFVIPTSPFFPRNSYICSPLLFKIHNFIFIAHIHIYICIILTWLSKSIVENWSQFILKDIVCNSFTEFTKDFLFLLTLVFWHIHCSLVITNKHIQVSR